MTLHTDRLIVAPRPPTEAAAVVNYYRRNRAHLQAWDPVRGPEFYTIAHWEAQLVEHEVQRQLGTGAPRFLALATEPERVIGTCNLSNIVRGVFQACHLGYGLDRELCGQGLMSEAAEAVVQWAFDELGLHRVMANYRPENAASARLLARLGFTVEGRAERYLFLDGAWRDHVLTARVGPDRPPHVQ